MTARTLMRAFTFAAAVLLIACDKTPTGPTPEPVKDPGPPVVRSLEMAGPEVIPLGGTGEFRLMAMLTDGSSRDVTNEANWRVGRVRAHVSTSSPGVVAGLERGEGFVEAQFGERRAIKDVLVLPAGTYRLMGTVMEAGSPSGPVREAVVDVTTGAGVHMTTETDRAGRYVFYGVSGGETRLRVAKNGYQPATRTAFVTDHTATYDVTLPLLAPRAEVAGVYTLTLTAADECRLGVGEGHLPEEARVRTYQAEVRQDGPRLEMMLSGATLRSRPILGRVEPGRVVFDLGDVVDDSDTDVRLILDKLATSGFLAIGGGAYVTGSANRLSGTLQGGFHVFETESIWSSIAWCYTERHQFVLSR